MSIKFKPIYTRYLQFKVFARILFVRVPYLVILSFQGEWQQDCFRAKDQHEKRDISSWICPFFLVSILCLSCVYPVSHHSPHSIHPDSHIIRIVSDSFRLNAARMKRACHLLRSTLMSVGFSDMLYFSKKFRAYTGVSPTDYRKQIQKKY